MGFCIVFTLVIMSAVIISYNLLILPLPAAATKTITAKFKKKLVFVSVTVLADIEICILDSDFIGASLNLFAIHIAMYLPYYNFSMLIVWKNISAPNLSGTHG